MVEISIMPVFKNSNEYHLWIVVPLTNQYCICIQLIIGDFSLSYDQAKSQMALWSVMAVQMLMSNDLRKIGLKFQELLLNKEVIAVNQDKLGIMGKRIMKVGLLQGVPKRCARVCGHRPSHEPFCAHWLFFDLFSIASICCIPILWALIECRLKMCVGLVSGRCIRISG